MSETRCASFRKMPYIPDKIITELALSQSEDAEQLWKLLKYTDVNALTKPNLTLEEKVDLIWSPEKVTPERTQDTFNVFLKPLIPASLNTSESQTQLRIYRNRTSAISIYQSTISYQLDVIVNESSCMVRTLENILVEKTDYIEMLLIELLNTMDVGTGINFLRFDRLSGGNSVSELNINNSKSLYGRSFILVLSYIDTSLGGGCHS
jgi:hypothetical protein